MLARVAARRFHTKLALRAVQTATATKVTDVAERTNRVEDAPYKPSEEFLRPPHVRLHQTNPNVLPSTTSIVPDDNDFEDYILDMPSAFENTVGSERAELVNPHVWDDLLPLLISPSSGVGSSIFNPIIIKSHGAEERVVGCFGECYEGNNADFEEAEMQFWVMQENTFGICDECGLVFYLASPTTVAQMELWRELKREVQEGRNPLKIE